MMSMMGGVGGGNLWQEMLPGENGKPISSLLEKQYDVVYGSWPNSYDEIVLVLDENNELDDITLYALGLKPKADIDAIMDAAMNKKPITPDGKSWTYEEICQMEFRTILPSDCFARDEKTGLYTDLRDTDAGLRYLYDNGTVLRVSGIIRPSEEAVSNMLTGSIGYTSKLTEYVIEHARQSNVVKAQLDSPETDIFTGLPFADRNGTMDPAEKEARFRAYVAGQTLAEKAKTYIAIMSIPSQEQLDAMVSKMMTGLTRPDMEKAMIQAISMQTGMASGEMEAYIAAMSDEEITRLFTEMAAEQAKMQYAAQMQGRLKVMTDEQLAAADYNGDGKVNTQDARAMLLALILT